MPLFDERSRKGWGHIDLLALTADGRPIVVELKRQDSTETPLRAAVEGLANAIAVEECWLEMSAELRDMCERSDLGCLARATSSVEFDWPFDADPSVRPAEADW